jgi:predicted NUDIX family NTP pyrophosphohydrolase
VAKRSAGLLLYRRGESGVEVFLVHPGGPYWEKKDLGAWTIPKGEYVDGEEALDAARREFSEETGFVAEGKFVELGTVRQAGGKVVSAWAVEGDCDAAKLVSNTCEIEWPPRTGRKMEIPEVDRGGWFSLTEAREKMFEAQREFLGRLGKTALSY